MLEQLLGPKHDVLNGKLQGVIDIDAMVGLLKGMTILEHIYETQNWNTDGR